MYVRTEQKLSIKLIHRILYMLHETIAVEFINPQGLVSGSWRKTSLRWNVIYKCIIMQTFTEYWLGHVPVSKIIFDYLFSIKFSATLFNRSFYGDYCKDIHKYYLHQKPFHWFSSGEILEWISSSLVYVLMCVGSVRILRFECAVWIGGLA